MIKVKILIDSWEELQFRSIHSTPPEEPGLNPHFLSLNKSQIEKLLLEAQRESATASGTQTPRFSNRSRYLN